MDLRTAINTSHPDAGPLCRAALERYDVPRHLHEGLVRYFVAGIRPGSFLLAVLENDLRRAAAVSSSPEALVPILTFLAIDVPAASWGSAEAVGAWVQARSARRREEMCL